MSLNERDLKILKDVVIDKNIKAADLNNSYGLSRRQIDYRFKKINEWLQENQLPEVKRTSQGYFVVDPIVKSIVSSEVSEKHSTLSVPNSKEREQLIMLMLFLPKLHLTLTYFADHLDTSKNTILTNLKAVKKSAAQYNLAISYSRKWGYSIEGNEFDIRRLLLHTIENVLNLLEGKQWFTSVTGISNLNIREFHSIVEKIETDLNARFTDAKLQILPYYLAILFQRIEAGQYVEHFPVSSLEVSDTKEYKVAGNVLTLLPKAPEEEKLFMALKLLSTNIAASSFVEEVLPELTSSIEEMLVRFERITMIELKNKEALLKQILTHMRPAYYRIVYQLTTDNYLHSAPGSEFENLRYLVKRSAEPLEAFLETEVSNEEITYLTMLIGGWLNRQGDSIENKFIAVVVCPNGVSLSKHLNSTLSSLFPEFIFMEAMSIREFRQYKRDFQIVFSPTLVETEKNLFIVDPFLNAEQKRQLRKRVLGQMNGISPLKINQENLLAIIQKYTTVHDKESLSHEISKYFEEEMTEFQGIEDDESPSIIELLKENHILFRHHIDSLGEGIRIASEPLIQQGYITRDYVNAMVELHDIEDPYAVLGPQTAIPHARVEDGVHKLGLSFLKLDTPFNISEDLHIHLIAILLPDSYGNHLKALQELEHITLDGQKLTFLRQTQKPNQFYYSIKQFVQERKGIYE